MRFLLTLFILITSHCALAQPDSTLLTVKDLPENYFTTISHKISSLEYKLTRQTEKYLQKLQRQEDKILKQLAKTDSSARALLSDAGKKYTGFAADIKSKAGIINKVTGGQYNGYLDSLGTSLTFLKQFSGITDKVKEPLKNLQQLESQLQQAEKVKAFIAERKTQIKHLLSRYTKLPPGLKKQYEQLSKTAYYYSAQVKEYKEMLKDPKKIEQKALALLNKLPAFQKFMKENSQLAQLFRIPGSGNATGGVPSIAGLQTRAQVNSMIAQQISMGGPNARAQVQQNLAQAHAEINKLKDQINKVGGGSGDIEMPDFKPNEQKTKSFLKRLEFGSNIQSVKGTGLLPATTDIGLSIGYKLNDKSILGIGASYKIGLGTIQHINITHQGVGFRSFVDYKIKKSFFLSGGYEMNYKAQFRNIAQLKNFSAWQSSGLIGLSKKYKISKKIKGNMQLLWDVMSYQQIPRTQPVVYRLGYTLK